MDPALDALAHPYTSVLARWFVAGVLLISSVSKLFDRAGLVQAVEAYRILPTRLSRTVALALPYTELLLGVALLLGLWTRIAAGLNILLFLSFAGAIAINLARGSELDCHCFGALYRKSISPASLFHVGVLALLATYIAIFTDDYLTLDRLLFGPQNSGAAAPPASGLVPFVLAVVTIGITGTLLQQMRLMVRRKGL